MDSVVGIVDVLSLAFSSCQDKSEQDELMGYLNKYMYVPQCQNFIINHVRNLKSGNTEELQHIYQELMQKGDLELAKKVNTLVNGEVSISEESYAKLESYFESQIFPKHIESNLTHFI